MVVLSGATASTHVRLDVYPDGGMARLRLWGRPTDEGLDALRRRWAETTRTVTEEVGAVPDEDGT